MLVLHQLLGLARAHPQDQDHRQVLDRLEHNVAMHLRQESLVAAAEIALEVGARKVRTIAQLVMASGALMAQNHLQLHQPLRLRCHLRHLIVQEGRWINVLIYAHLIRRLSSFVCRLVSIDVGPMLANLLFDDGELVAGIPFASDS